MSDGFKIGDGVSLPGGSSVKSFNAVGDGATDDSDAILSAVNSGNKNVAIPQGNYRIGKNITIPSGMTLHFADGAVLEPDSGVTVTINAGISAGLTQIFGGSGTIAGSLNVTEVYPEWWGAAGDGITDDTNALESAFATMKRCLLTGIYGVSSTITVSAAQEIVGTMNSNIPATIRALSNLDPVMNVSDLLDVNVYEYGLIERIKFDGSATGSATNKTAASGLSLGGTNSCYGLVLRDVVIANFTGAGLYLQAHIVDILSYGIKITNCGQGINSNVTQDGEALTFIGGYVYNCTQYGLVINSGGEHNFYGFSFDYSGLDNVVFASGASARARFIGGHNEGKYNLFFVNSGDSYISIRDVAFVFASNAPSTSAAITNQSSNTLIVAGGHYNVNGSSGNLLGPSSGSNVKFIDVMGVSLPSASATNYTSGAVYQNTKNMDVTIYQTVWATTSGTSGLVGIAFGPNNPPTLRFNEHISGSTSSSSPAVIKITVPLGWYYSFTTNGVTMGQSTIVTE